MKSTEVRLSLPDSCAVQCAPPSAVARIASWLTAHPCDADTNCRPSMPGGYEGACAPGQERPLAAVPAGAPDAGVPAGAVLAGAAAGGAAEPAAAELAAAGAAEFAPELAAWPPAAWSVPVPHPATTTDREARASNRVRMPCRRRNRARGCA